MLTPRANIHHSKLPNPGAIGFITGLTTVNPRRRCIVESYPLYDNILPYSIGIHTIWVRFLNNNERRRFSGFFFKEDDK